MLLVLFDFIMSAADTDYAVGTYLRNVRTVSEVDPKSSSLSVHTLRGLPSLSLSSLSSLFSLSLSLKSSRPLSKSVPLFSAVLLCSRCIGVEPSTHPSICPSVQSPESFPTLN